ncbi:Short-chain dehydrogenase/reductase [Lachnellula occidentalis]|uniref:Short-chain dehydrogenase/reductase n=1 Tax=Lachnellula occidentalis TaxID=215460 RepID=A0A8H8RS58_9HELO|nr:Short-chain dehydrogenase/reductase [Lachnellula occidentalis]
MVSLDVVKSANATLVKSQHFVAVFVSTSGIGTYALQALASHANEGQGIRAYIIARRKAAADRIISECQKLCPKGQFRFVQTDDIALLKNVDRVCAEITDAEAREVAVTGGKSKIDLLVMAQGILDFGGRKETKEGIDQSMSLLYYSRMRFITQLIPLLTESPLPGHVVSVFGPQRDEKLFLDDISLRNPKNYGFGSMGSHAAYLKTFYFEYLAAKYSGKLSLIHYYPRLVATDAFTAEGVPMFIKLTWKLMTPLQNFITVPKAECGERVLFLSSRRFPARDSMVSEQSAGGLEVAASSDGVIGGGAYRVNWDGGIIPIKKNYEKLRADGWGKKFVAHTNKVFADVEAGKVFTE